MNLEQMWQTFIFIKCLHDTFKRNLKLKKTSKYILALLQIKNCYILKYMAYQENFYELKKMIISGPQKFELDKNCQPLSPPLLSELNGRSLLNHNPIYSTHNMDGCHIRRLWGYLRLWRSTSKNASRKENRK